MVVVVCWMFFAKTTSDWLLAWVLTLPFPSSTRSICGFRFVWYTPYSPNPVCFSWVAALFIFRLLIHSEAWAEADFADRFVDLMHFSALSCFMDSFGGSTSPPGQHSGANLNNNNSLSHVNHNSSNGRKSYNQTTTPVKCDFCNYETTHRANMYRHKWVLHSSVTREVFRESLREIITNMRPHFQKNTHWSEKLRMLSVWCDDNQERQSAAAHAGQAWLRRSSHLA